MLNCQFGFSCAYSSGERRNANRSPSSRIQLIQLTDHMQLIQILVCIYVFIIRLIMHIFFIFDFYDAILIKWLLAKWLLIKLKISSSLYTYTCMWCWFWYIINSGYISIEWSVHQKWHFEWWDGRRKRIWTSITKVHYKIK